MGPSSRKRDRELRVVLDARPTHRERAAPRDHAVREHRPVASRPIARYQAAFGRGPGRRLADRL